MAVVANGDKYDFTCEVVNCGWSSTGWPEETMASQRGDQHYNEHVTKEPMPELIEFEGQVGFVRDPGAVPAPVTVTMSDGKQVTFDAQGNVVEEVQP